MEIKILNELDAEQYRTLRLEALQNKPEAFASSYEDEKDRSVESYANRMTSKFSFTFGVFDNDTLIGVVTLVIGEKLKLKHRSDIFAMYVTPDYRGRGVGKKLMQAAIVKAKELKEVEQVYLTVTATNAPAKQLYLSLGFEIYGTDKKAMKVEDVYYDEDLMVLYL